MKPSRFPAFARVSPLFACIAAISSGSALAANFYWDGSESEKIWGNALNWSTTTTPNTGSGTPGSADTAFFVATGVTGPVTVILDANQSVGGLSTRAGNGFITTIQGGAALGEDRVLQLGTAGITHDTGGLVIGSTTAGKVTLSLQGSQTWNSSVVGGTAGAQAIFVLNDVTLGVSGAQTLTLTGSNTGSKIDGVISDGTAGGTLALVKTNGTGAWNLNGANTYSGGTTLNAGTININNASALGTGTLTINAGTINNNTGAALTLSTNNAQVWNSSFSFTGTASLNLGTGAVSLGTAAGTSRTITSNNNTLSVGGVISNGTTANAIVKAGTGALTLSGANTYTGGTSLTAGTLNINNASALGTGTFTITAGTINNTSGAEVILTTNNAQVWDNNIAFTGGSSLNLGTGAVSMGTAVGTARTVTVSANTLTVGGAISDGTTATGLTKAGTGTLVLSGASTYTGATTISAGILSVGSLNSVVGGVAGSNLGAPTTVENGTIHLGALTVAGQLLYTGTGETTDRVLNLAGTSAGGTITQSGTGLLKFTSNLTATGIGNKTLTLQGSTAGTGEIAGIIGNGPTTSITSLAKSGTGTWTLSGANTYSGTTTVNDGVLRMAGAGLLGNGSGALTLNNAGQLDLNGTSQTVGNLNGSAATTITNNATGTTSTLTIGNANGTGTFSGLLTNGTGTFALTKIGTGTITLSGANSYGGLTTINGGILSITNPSALGTAAEGTVVAIGASLSLTGGITVAGESLTINGLGTNSQGALRNGAGDNTWAGAVLLGTDSGTAGTGNAARIGSQAGNLTISGVIQNGATGNVAIRNADSGGLVTFSGNNTYNGTTHLVVGALSVSSINSVATNAGLGTVHSASSNLGAPTTVANGTIHFATSAGAGELIYTGTGETTDRVINMAGTSAAGGAILTQSGTGLLKFTSALTVTGTGAKTLTLRGSTAGSGELAGAIVNGVGTISVAKSGTGTWTLSGANTYTGGTSVTGGTLIVSNGINLSSSLSVGNGTFRLGASNVIGDLAPVTLSVGGEIETNNFNDQAGVLIVTGDATISLNGTSVLQFADSSAAAWTGLLSITDWSGSETGGGLERLIFGSSSTGLTSDQLSRISFLNPDGFAAGTYGAAILANGEVVPTLIPEPSIALLALAGTGALVFRRRRDA